MNIVFVIGGLQGGGAEGVVANLTSQLAGRGHRITLICHLKGQVYQVTNQVNLIDVRSWQYDTFTGPLLARIYKKTVNRFLDYRNIKRVIRKENPDVVISFLGNWLWTLILICHGRIPLISAHRNAMALKLGRGNFSTKQIGYRLVYAVQVMSRWDKAWLRHRYKRILPMPNPLRFDPLTEIEYKEIFSKRKNILACGRLLPQKGFDKLIKAFSLVSEKYPEWKVDICGEDPATSHYSETLKALVAECGLENRISFIGFHKDVDRVMREHSIFCLSSVHEGFPNVLSEAMANGMACVSFDIVTGPSEIIVDGLDGMIVEDKNVDALAEGLALLMGDENLRYTYGQHAIKNIKRFSKEKIVDKWEKMFENIIKEFKYEKN